MISPAQSTALAQQVSGLGQLHMYAGSRSTALSAQPLTEKKHDLTHFLAIRSKYFNPHIERKTP